MTSGRRHVHVITPGDHFSPRTGSAVPTVVAGLTVARPASEPRDRVVVARGTYPDRYASAEVIEYESDPRHVPGGRYLDVLMGRLGRARPGNSRAWRATLTGQHDWDESVIFGHNAVALIRLVDASRHQPVLYAHNDLLRSYTRREATRALAPVHRIVCVSDYLADRVSSRLPTALADRVRVVPNGSDCAGFTPARERPGGPLSVLFLGRMIPDKGPDTLVRAARLLDRPDVSFQLVGSYGFDAGAPLSGYESELRRAAAPLGDRVRFMPAQPRAAAAELLRSADVVVIPSRWPDPCPLTVVEGLATGIVVVASAVGGIPQSLDDAGILVPPDDPAALAEALRSVAEDPALRDRLGRAARRRAEQRDWAWAREQLAAALR